MLQFIQFYFQIILNLFIPLIIHFKLYVNQNFLNFGVKVDY